MDSSDSDDYVITNFVGGKEKLLILDDGEPLLKKYKVEKDGVGDFDLEVDPGDGHCISHCFSRHFKEPLNVVLQRVKSEFL